MTREQIEKAANIEMLSHYADGEYPWGINDIQSDFIEAFSKGAQWRINSVWHDAYERPDSGRVFLYIGKSLEDGETKFDTDCLYPNENWEDFVFGEAMEEWAYLDDLIPERKEETNGGR